jgi:hypothetical protein
MKMSVRYFTCNVSIDEGEPVLDVQPFEHTFNVRFDNPDTPTQALVSVTCTQEEFDASGATEITIDSAIETSQAWDVEHNRELIVPE